MNEQNAVWPFFAWNPFASTFATSLAADMATDFASALTQTASAVPDLAPQSLMQSILADWSFEGVEVDAFAGEPAIEKEVVENVASYGKQLGILTEALLALVADDPADDERIERLRTLAQEIETVKGSRKSDLVASAKRAMKSLAKSDPAAAARLAREYASDDSNER